MRDIDLQTLPMVQALADTGSFTAAALQLGCSKTKISLQISQLERQLGVMLFHRTTRQVRLTDQGQQFLAELMPHWHALAQGMAHWQQQPEQLSGRLVISAPEDYAAQVLVPLVAQFAKQHPQLQIELRSSDQVQDILRQGIDVAIRVGWLTDSSLVSRRLGSFEQWLVGAPQLAAAATPNTEPQALAALPFLGFTPLPQPWLWRFQRQNQSCSIRFQGTITTSSTGTLTSLLLAGAGIGVMTDYSARPWLASGQLVRLCPDWQLAEGGIYAVYPPGSVRPLKVRLFIQALETQLMRAEH